MPISLLYHDVVPYGQADTIGFPGPGAARYKISPEEYDAHLEAIRRAVDEAPALAPALSGSWMITFDDGGSSAVSPIADGLETRGWHGHFFITTDFIDKPGFLDAARVRELRARGHLVGSHSCSHPARMTDCSPEQLRHEWQDSREKLQQLLGEAITVGSVPSGFYSRRIARAVAAAGYKCLFTSEPTQVAVTVDGCRIFGRYCIIRGDRPAHAAAIAAGHIFPRLRQTLTWDLKKVAKSVGGNWYQHLRRGLLSKAYQRDESPRRLASSRSERVQ
jgi:hypothetical protein